MGIILFLLCLLIPSTADAARRYLSVEGPTGHSSCVTGEDENGDGLENNCSSNTSISDEGTFYAIAFDTCLVAGDYATTTDATFAQGSFVAKAAGGAYFAGQIRCSGTVDAGTYYLDLYSSTPSGAASICVSSSGINPFTVNNGTTCTWIPEHINPNWTNQSLGGLKLSGANINFGNKVSAGDRFTFVHGGGVLYLDFMTSADIRLSCATLSTDAAQVSACPSETPTVITPAYTMLKAPSAPANCAALANGNPLTLNGTNSNYTDSAPTIRFLHHDSTIYFCVTKPDNDLKTTSSTADVIENNSDRVEIASRNSTSTNARDENTFKFSVNLLNAKYSANYPGNVANTAQSLSEATTISLTGDIDLTADDTSSQWFGSFTGFTITDDTFINMEVMIFDADQTGNSYRLAFGTGINTPATWGTVLLSGTEAAGGDVTAPVVTAFTCGNNITTTSMTCTFAVDEDGLATIRNASNVDLTAQVATVNGVGSIAVTGLNPNTAYTLHARMCDAAANCSDSSADSQSTLAESGTQLYAGPTGTGAMNCSSLANRGTWATCASLSSLQPGTTLWLADGTYTGTGNMMIPPTGKNGTAQAPIFVKAINDGAVLFNGQNSRIPCDISGVAWWEFHGFNCANSNASGVIYVHNFSSNLVFKRLGAWDNDSDVASSAGVIVPAKSSNLLFEDIFGFGRGRKILSSPQDSTNITMRRAFAVWSCLDIPSSDPNSKGPRMAATNLYDSVNTVYENLILLWDDSCSSPNNDNYGLFGQDANKAATGYCANQKYLSSMGIMRASYRVTSGWIGALFMGGSGGCVESRDITLVNLGTSTALRAIVVQPFGPTCAAIGGCDRRLTNISKIGTWSVSDIIATGANGITQTNVVSYASAAAAAAASASPFQATAAGAGARMCFRSEAGSLTSTKLWPWPMNARISAAWTASGRNTNTLFGTGIAGVTELVESIFGTIPAACKS